MHHESDDSGFNEPDHKAQKLQMEPDPNKGTEQLPAPDDRDTPVKHLDDDAAPTTAGGVHDDEQYEPAEQYEAEQNEAKPQSSARHRKLKLD